MNTQENGKYELKVVVLLGFAFGFAFYDRMIMTFLTPFVIPTFNLNNTQVGTLGAGLSLTWAIGAYVFGRMSDRFGVRKPFLLGAMIIFSICSVLSGLATGFWSLLASRVLMGAVEGPFLPICLAIVAAATPLKRQGLNAGVVQNAFGSLIGAAIAPIIVVAIAEHFGWRTSFFTAAIPGLILAFIVWRVIDEPASPKLPILASDEINPGIFNMLAQRNIALCSVISCLLVGSAVLGSIFLPVYLTSIRGYSPTQMSAIMAGLGLCSPVGGILVPFLSDHFGRRPMLIIFSGLMMVTPFAAVYFSGPSMVLAALLFIGWIGLGVFPLFMGVVPSETLNFRNTAAAMGLVIAIGELIGGVLAPIGAGLIADVYGLKVPLLLSAVMCIAAMFVAVALKETNHNALTKRRLAIESL
jgi:predicted MFS family arabinose efflux permease